MRRTGTYVKDSQDGESRVLSMRMLKTPSDWTRARVPIAPLSPEVPTFVST